MGYETTPTPLLARNPNREPQPGPALDGDPRGCQRSPGTGGPLRQGYHLQPPPEPPGLVREPSCEPSRASPSRHRGQRGGRGARTSPPPPAPSRPPPGFPPEELRGREGRRSGSPLAHTWGSAGAGRGEGATHTLQQAPPLRRHLAAAASSFPTAPARPPPSGGGRALRGGSHARGSGQGEVVGRAVVKFCHPTR